MLSIGEETVGGHRLVTLETTLWRNGDSQKSALQVFKKDNVKPLKSYFNEEGLM